MEILPHPIKIGRVPTLYLRMGPSSELSQSHKMPLTGTYAPVVSLKIYSSFESFNDKSQKTAKGRKTLETSAMNQARMLTNIYPSIQADSEHFQFCGSQDVNWIDQ